MHPVLSDPERNKSYQAYRIPCAGACTFGQLITVSQCGICLLLLDWCSCQPVYAVMTRLRLKADLLLAFSLGSKRLVPHCVPDAYKRTQFGAFSRRLVCSNKVSLREFCYHAKNGK